MTNIKPPERVYVGANTPPINDGIMRVSVDKLRPDDTSYILESSVQSRIQLAVLEEKLRWVRDAPDYEQHEMIKRAEEIEAEIQKLKKEIGDE